MKKILLMVMLSMAALSASAEKADSAKQTVINYDSLDVDDVAQTSILNGNVVITKGTLLLKSDKAVIKESPDGYRTITLTATGKNATFRQKRDAGPNLWVRRSEPHRIRRAHGNRQVVQQRQAARTRRGQADPHGGERIHYLRRAPRAVRDPQ